MIREKVKKCVTDSTKEITYDPEKRPGEILIKTFNNNANVMSLKDSLIVMLYNNKCSRTYILMECSK